jgi:hypothetical protein
MALCAQASHALQLRLKLDSNEVHFTLEALTIFPHYLTSHCSGETDVHKIALPAHGLKAKQVRLKLVGNEGRFTLVTEKVFHLCPDALQWGD